jgi:hypothetical protein
MEIFVLKKLDLFFFFSFFFKRKRQMIIFFLTWTRVSYCNTHHPGVSCLNAIGDMMMDDDAWSITLASGQKGLSMVS